MSNRFAGAVASVPAATRFSGRLWLVGATAVFIGLVTFFNDSLPAQAPAKKETADRIQPGDRLYIHVIDTLPELPIKGVYRTEPSGKVSLGPVYGRVQLQNLTLEDAEEVVRNHLAKILKDPQVSLTQYDAVAHGGAVAREQALERRLGKVEKELTALRAAIGALPRKR
jgi:protein involved in polysaccharide export with SLBB domain